MRKFGNYKTLNLRDMWQSESRDFTPWLAENINSLSEELGMDLEIIEEEAEVGAFSLDILAKDLGSNRIVIIENQITSTDHDHLGKLLTYASGYDASVVIWVSEKLRDEHRQALEWLNQITDEKTEFFGITIEVFKIDESDPAFRFNLVVYPNTWQKDKRTRPGKQESPRAESYREFFQVLIDELREKHRFTNAKKGQPQGWYCFSSGYTGINYCVSFAMGNKVRAEMSIGIGDSKSNKALFDFLHAQKTDLESKFGEQLSWERLDEKKASRVAIYRPGTIESDKDDLHEIRNWFIDRVLKFDKTFDKILKSYFDNLSNSM